MTGVCTLLRVLQRLHWPDTLPGMWIESLQLECEELANTSEDLNSLNFWSVVSCGNSGYQRKWPWHGRRHASWPRQVCFLSQVFLFKLLNSNMHPNGHFHCMSSAAKCDPCMCPVALLIQAHTQTLVDSGLQTPRASGSCKMTTYSWEAHCWLIYSFLKVITSTASL